MVQVNENYIKSTFYSVCKPATTGVVRDPKRTGIPACLLRKLVVTAPQSWQHQVMVDVYHLVSLYGHELVRDCFFERPRARCFGKQTASDHCAQDDPMQTM